MITLAEARRAAETGVFLEISARPGHGLANGHVAQVARRATARLVVNTDTHRPGDMIDQDRARLIAAAAGLTADEVYAATVTNPQAAVERARARLKPGQEPK